MSLRVSCLIAGLLAACVALAAPARGAEPPPTADCGVTATDRAGDNVNQTTNQQGTPNTDVKEVFFRYAVKDGKPALTANIRVAELDTTVQAPYTAHWYQLEFTVNKKPKLLAAVIDAAGLVSFYYGHPREITDTDPSPSYEGDTTGRLYEGPDGVIEIDMPIEAMELAGGAISGLTFEVRQAVGRTSVTIPAPIIFVAPIVDDGSGKGAFPVAPCAKPDVPTTAAPVVPAPVAPVTETAKAAPELRVTAPRVKALRKGRSFAVALQSTAPLSAVTAQLRKGRTVLAQGKLARLASKGSVRLKARRAVRKGTYQLLVTAKAADGTALSRAVAVRVR